MRLMLVGRPGVRRLARRAVRATQLPRRPGVRSAHEWYLARTERGKECTFGTYTLAYPSRSVIGQAVASRTGWDNVLVPLIERLVARHDPLIVDVCSHIGASPMQINIANPRSRVYCC